MELLRKIVEFPARAVEEEEEEVGTVRSILLTECTCFFLDAAESDVPSGLIRFVGISSVFLLCKTLQ